MDSCSTRQNTPIPKIPDEKRSFLTELEAKVVSFFLLFPTFLQNKDEWIHNPRFLFSVKFGDFIYWGELFGSNKHKEGGCRSNIDGTTTF